MTKLSHADGQTINQIRVPGLPPGLCVGIDVVGFNHEVIPCNSDAPFPLGVTQRAAETLAAQPNSLVEIFLRDEILPFCAPGLPVCFTWLDPASWSIPPLPGELFPISVLGSPPSAIGYAGVLVRPSADNPNFWEIMLYGFNALIPAVATTLSYPRAGTYVGRTIPSVWAPLRSLSPGPSLSSRTPYDYEQWDVAFIDGPPGSEVYFGTDHGTDFVQYIKLGTIQANGALTVPLSLVDDVSGTPGIYGIWCEDELLVNATWSTPQGTMRQATEVTLFDVVFTEVIPPGEPFALGLTNWVPSSYSGYPSALVTNHDITDHLIEVQNSDDAAQPIVAVLSILAGETLSLPFTTAETGAQFGAILTRAGGYTGFPSSSDFRYRMRLLEPTILGVRLILNTLRLTAN